MRRKILLAYDGSDYSGWQIQEIANGPPTIQGELEIALSKLSGEKIRVIGSGRTDAGVHAYGQTAHFDSDSEKIAHIPDLRFTLNAILPKTIRILQIEESEPSFHAQHKAISKTYIYQLWQEEAFMPPFLTRRAWSCGPLDVDILAAGAQCFTGEHDFASFQNAGTDIKNTLRNVFDCHVEKLPGMPYFPAHLPMLAIKITAGGFLKQMARNIAGFLVYAAKGKLELGRLKEIFQKRNRRYLPSPTAPAHGLALARVEYPENCG